MSNKVPKHYLDSFDDGFFIETSKNERILLRHQDESYHLIDHASESTEFSITEFDTIFTAHDETTPSRDADYNVCPDGQHYLFNGVQKDGYFRFRCHNDNKHHLTTGTIQKLYTRLGDTVPLNIDVHHFPLPGTKLSLKEFSHDNFIIKTEENDHMINVKYKSMYWCDKEIMMFLSIHNRRELVDNLSEAKLKASATGFYVDKPFIILTFNDLGQIDVNVIDEKVLNIVHK